MTKKRNVLADIQALFLANEDNANDHFADISDDDAVLDLPDPKFVIDGWVPRGLYTMLYGAPGVGKTFALLGMSRAVRRGTRWQDNKTTKGAVLFYQGEGLSQLKPRIRAWDERYPLRPDQSMAPGGFLDRFVDLTKPEGIAAIVRTVRKYQKAKGCKVAMVVIDPLVEFMTGDENGEGMEKATRGLRALASYLNIAVVVGHHTNANGDRARGAEFHRMRAGAFMQMEELQGEQVGIWQNKQKNSERLAVILDPIEQSESVVLEWVGNMPFSAYLAMKESEAKSRKKAVKAAESSDKRKQAREVLTEVVRDGTFDKPGDRSENKIVARALSIAGEHGLDIGRPVLKDTLDQMRDPQVLGLIRTEPGPNRSTLHYWQDDES